MKYKTARIICVIAALVVAGNALFYFTTGISIPALQPFFLSIALLFMIYIVKKQLEEKGKENKSYWTTLFIIILVTVIMNIIIGISQIISAFK